MRILDDSLRAEEQRRANEIVAAIAASLGVPTTEEVVLELAEVRLLSACYRGWQIDVYLELLG
jgi:hypothetical protein